MLTNLFSVTVPTIVLGLIVWIPSASAYPVPVGPEFIPGQGINFNSESCCISYDAATDRLVAVSSGQMDIYGGESFEGTWLLDTYIDETFQVTNPGTVSLFGDIGEGIESLITGTVSHIGFSENFTDWDQPTAFYGIFFMQIVFNIHEANSLMSQIFGHSGSFLTGHRIGDIGYFEPGESTYSPFSDDFRCGSNAYRCTLNEGSYGLNAIVSVTEPSTFALFSAGIIGLSFACRRKKA